VSEEERPEFNVIYYFEDDWHYYAPNGRNLMPKDAGELALSYATRPAAQMGIIKKVIITDGGDHTCFVWEFGKGVTYRGDEQ
jgi:hypothetical protein